MRNRAAIPLLLILSVLSACTPSVGQPPLPSLTPSPGSGPGEAIPFPPTPTSLPGERPRIVHSASLSLTVEDPSTALSLLQEAIVDAGGFVASASSWSSPGSTPYASLSAKVPPDALPEVRRAAIGLALQLQSDSLYSQDVTLESLQLQDRLQAISMAENHLWMLLLQTTDPQLARSLTILRELIGDEKESIQYQLTDLERRAEFASFDVSLNSPPALLSIE